jgi:hypothetical protein
LSGCTVEELAGAFFIRFIPRGTVTSSRPGSGHHDGHLLEIEASSTTITWKGKKRFLVLSEI